MTQLVITQGDPDGVGPELLLRMAAEGVLHPEDRVFAGRAKLRGLAESLTAEWAAPGWAKLEPLLDPSLAERDPSAPLGQFEALERGVDRVLEDVRKGAPAALVTAPIDKAVASREGLRHPGHTEYLAERAGVEDFAMLMAGSTIRVVLATIHLPLRAVFGALDQTAIVRAGSLLARSLVQDYGIAEPVVGVLGLNPHAGEGGLLGDEEQTLIAPAIEALGAWAAQAQLPARFVGPLPADTAFHHNRGGRVHGLVAMYHDQGLGPFKLAHFSDGVNVTLGLPFVRTSPDHGTAKDIAGRGVADASSMRAAIELARAMSRARAQTQTQTPR